MIYHNPLAPMLLLTMLACAMVRSEAAASSAVVPGIVVGHLSASSGLYVGSPSLAILPNGDYVASHDDFGPVSTLNRTLVFRSADRGVTWQREAEVMGQYWSTLFVHRGALYLLGTSREYGDVVIRRSDDGGRTWTAPQNEHSGLLQPRRAVALRPRAVASAWRASLAGV